MNDDGITMAEVGLAFIPVLTAVVAGLIGWLLGRGKERREMRKQAYVDWLRAARNLASPPPGAALTPLGNLIAEELGDASKLVVPGLDLALRTKLSPVVAAHLEWPPPRSRSSHPRRLAP
jgi:hypothetical protein